MACLFGLHDWQLRFYRLRGGIAFGKQCKRCNKWHRSAIKAATD